MAWYDKLNYSKTKPLTSATVNAEQDKEKETPVPEKWIWVEGYKGIDQNMKAYDDFQYEVGVEYTVDGEPEVCNNGFHFCLSLKDVFGYQNCLGRFFKVKAYVREKDYASYGTIKSYGWGGTKIDKLAAKKIILTEEITDTEESITSSIYKNYPEIQTEDDIQQARIIGYEKFVTNKCKNMLSKYFSELFIELFINKHLHHITASGTRYTSESTLMANTKEIITYMEEGVSKDVAIYLLMK